MFLLNCLASFLRSLLYRIIFLFGISTILFNPPLAPPRRGSKSVLPFPFLFFASTLRPYALRLIFLFFFFFFFFFFFDSPCAFMPLCLLILRKKASRSHQQYAQPPARPKVQGCCPFSICRQRVCPWRVLWQTDLFRGVHWCRLCRFPAARSYCGESCMVRP